jgi:hypothetical protein
MKYFDPSALNRLKSATVVAKTGVRHGFVDGILFEDKYNELIDALPDHRTFTLVDKQSGGGHKRFYVGPVYLSGKDFGSVYHMRGLPRIWQEFLAEAGSRELITLLSESTGTKFNSLNNFGVAYGDEGCIQEPHIDGAIRSGDASLIKGNIALLMYFNRVADPISATELYDLDRKTVLAKGYTMRNSVFFFEQHPNSWHGFPEVPHEHTRHILSLAYSDEARHIPLRWSFTESIIPIGKWRWQIAKKLA